MPLLVSVNGVARLPSARKPRWIEVVCESTYVAPAIDAAIAIAGSALIAWGATAKQDPEGHVVTGRNFAEIPGFLLAVPFGFSSVYGFVTVGQCKGAAREAGAVAVRR